jgi:hypothetical protein
MADGSHLPLGGQRPASNPLKRFVPLWKATGKHPVLFRCLNQWVFGLDTHYQAGRVFPCTMALSSCATCAQGWLPRWRGFVGGEHHATRGRYLLQITATAWRECAELPDRDGQLRGSYWTVRRAGDSAQARLIWSAVAMARQEPPSQPIDVVEVLSRLWGLDLLKLHHDPSFAGDARPLLQVYPEKRGKK